MTCLIDRDEECLGGYKGCPREKGEDDDTV